MGDSPLNTGEHITQSLEIEQPGGGVGARTTQQDMVGLVLAQHVVNKVGREQHLAAAFLLAGEAARDQARYQRTLRKVRFISADSASHASRSSPSMSAANKCGEIELAVPDHERHVAEAPHGKRIFIGDEAERPHPRPLHPPRQQHAERLVRQPSLEGIADEVMLAAAGKGFDQQLAHRRHK